MCCFAAPLDRPDSLPYDRAHANAHRIYITGQIEHFLTKYHFITISIKTDQVWSPWVYTFFLFTIILVAFISLPHILHFSFKANSNPSSSPELPTIYSTPVNLSLSFCWFLQFWQYAGHSINSPFNAPKECILGIIPWELRNLTWGDSGMLTFLISRYTMPPMRMPGEYTLPDDFPPSCYWNGGIIRHGMQNAVARAAYSTGRRIIF